MRGPVRTNITTRLNQTFQRYLKRKNHLEWIGLSKASLEREPVRTNRFTESKFPKSKEVTLGLPQISVTNVTLKQWSVWGVAWMNLRGWRVSHNKERHIHIPYFLSCYAETLYLQTTKLCYCYCGRNNRSKWWYRTSRLKLFDRKLLLTSNRDSPGREDPSAGSSGSGSGLWGSAALGTVQCSGRQLAAPGWLGSGETSGPPGCHEPTGARSAWGGEWELAFWGTQHGQLCAGEREFK